jgi:YHS domain-containing protein
MLLAAIVVPVLIVGCDAAPRGAAASSPPSVAPGTSQASPARRNGFDGMPPVGAKAVCPVMGNELTVTRDTVSSVYQGKTYVFCCPACKPQFDADPARYVGKL